MPDASQVYHKRELEKGATPGLMLEVECIAVPG